MTMKQKMFFSVSFTVVKLDSDVIVKNSIFLRGDGLYAGKTMRIAIAGANGWLGSRIVRAALRSNHQVLCILRRNADASRLHGLQNRIATACSEEEEESLKEFLPDVVVCTTCSYKTNFDFIEESISANYAYPARLLIRTQKIGCPRFISIATSLPPGLNLYSFTKKQFSLLGRFLAEKDLISFVSLRCEAIYGTDEPENRFISRVIRQLRNNEPIELTEGCQHRDFVWIGDVVSILLHSLTAELSAISEIRGPKMYAEIPVGSGTAPTIRELVTFLKEELNSKSELKWGTVPLRNDEPDLCADLSLIRKTGYAGTPLFWKDGMTRLIKGQEP